MKKSLGFILIMISVFLFTDSIYAACSQQVDVGGESLCLLSNDSKNSSQTAYVEDGVLVLNNYNGSSIKFPNTGLGNPLNGTTIKLIGDNYITSDQYGLLFYVTGIHFEGDGQLTINSKIPFVSYDLDRESFVDAENRILREINANRVSTIVIQSGASIQKDNIMDNPSVDNPVITDDSAISDDKNETEEVKNTTTENHVVMIIIALSYFVVSLIIIIVLIIKLCSIKKYKD